MAKGEQYEARVEAWITPVLEQHQFELVDVEYVREVASGICGATLTKRAVLPLMTAR